jgi:hypothetical protein
VFEKYKTSIGMMPQQADFCLLFFSERFMLINLCFMPRRKKWRAVLLPGKAGQTIYIGELCHFRQTSNERTV